VELLQIPMVWVLASIYIGYKLGVMMGRNDNPGKAMNIYAALVFVGVILSVAANFILMR